jgi:uncharacterized membrane protein YdbT with pleckstrin-like domain
MKTQLKPDEKIILITKPHWLTLSGPSFLVFIVLVADILAGYMLGLEWSKYLSILLVLTGFYLLYKIVQRNRNIWVVTNLRVIDEYGVFTSNSKESPLDKINNVTYRQPFWGKIFGYGNVQIQTAAEIGSTTYYNVERPQELKNSITNMQEEYKQQQIRKQASELANAMIAGQQEKKTDIASELEKLHELWQKGILTEAEYNAGKAKILNS